MDALSDAEWDTCATMIMEYQRRPFYKAEGIPRGGVKLANALNKYASGDPADQVLICDDVYTTGSSFRDYIDVYYPMWTMGQGYRWVVFARNPSYKKDFVKFTQSKGIINPKLWNDPTQPKKQKRKTR